MKITIDGNAYEADLALLLELFERIQGIGLLGPWNPRCVELDQIDVISIQALEALFDSRDSIAR